MGVPDCQDKWYYNENVFNSETGAWLHARVRY